LTAAVDKDQHRSMATCVLVMAVAIAARLLWPDIPPAPVTARDQSSSMTMGILAMEIAAQPLWPDIPPAPAAEVAAVLVYPGTRTRAGLAQRNEPWSCAKS